MNNICKASLVYCLLLFSLVLANEGYSAAWSIKQGASQIIHTLSTYYTDSYYDNSGEKKESNTFKKVDYSVSYEYGWKSNTVFGLKPALQYISNELEGGELQPYTGSAFVGLLDLFIRKELYKDAKHVVSIQPLITFPAISHNIQTNIDTNNLATEIRALHGYNFNFLDTNGFLNNEFALRIHPKSNIRSALLDITLGIKLENKQQVLVQLFNSINTQADQFTEVSSSSAIDNSYDLTKLQLSYVRPINRSKQIQIGGFADIAGKNTGAGGGLIISLWHSF